jgi:hypothetical protein
MFTHWFQLILLINRVKMMYKPVLESQGGLTYILFAADFATNAINQVRTSA